MRKYKSFTNILIHLVLLNNLYFNIKNNRNSCSLQVSSTVQYNYDSRILNFQQVDNQINRYRTNIFLYLYLSSIFSYVFARH